MMEFTNGSAVKGETGDKVSGLRKWSKRHEINLDKRHQTAEIFAEFQRGLPSGEIEALYSYLLEYRGVLDDIKARQREDNTAQPLLQAAQRMIIAEAIGCKARTLSEVKKKLHLMIWLTVMVDEDPADPTAPRAVAYSAYHDLLEL